MPAPSSRLHTLLAPLAVLGSVTSLCLGTSLAKQLFPLVGAGGTSALRVGFSALILLALWRPWRWPLARRDGWAVLRYGLVLGAMNLLFYLALRTIPFGIAVAIEFAGPLAVAMLSSRRWLDGLWLLLAAAGLALLLPLGHRGALDPTGLACAVAAALCWALYIVFGQQAGRIHAGQSVSLGLCVASVVVVPVGAWQAGAALLDPWVLLAGLGIAAISSALPMSLEMVALRRMRRQHYGVLISLEPAVAALAGLALLGEQLQPRQWLAIALIVAASVGSTLRSRHPAIDAEVPTG